MGLAMISPVLMQNLAVRCGASERHSGKCDADAASAAGGVSRNVSKYLSQNMKYGSTANLRIVQTPDCENDPTKYAKAMPGPPTAPALDLPEIPEQAAAPSEREPGKIVSFHMHLLHEGDFRVDHPALLQHSVDLVYAPLRVDDVLQNCLGDDVVKRSVYKGQIVSVRNCVYPLVWVHSARTMGAKFPSRAMGAWSEPQRRQLTIHRTWKTGAERICRRLQMDISAMNASMPTGFWTSTMSNARFGPGEKTTTKHGPAASWGT